VTATYGSGVTTVTVSGSTDALAYHNTGDAFTAAKKLGLTDNFQLDLLQNNVGRIKFLAGADAGRIVYGGTDYGYFHNFTGNVYYNDAVVFNSSAQASTFSIGSSGSLITNSGANTQIIGGTSSSFGHLVLYSAIGAKLGIDIDASGFSNFGHTAIFQAGTTTEAPAKFQAGTNLTSVVNGAVEYDGTNYFASQGGVRYTLAKTLTATATLDFASTAAQNSSDLTITITGAALGDVVEIGAPNGSILSNSSYTAWVSATDTIKVRFNNYSSGAQDPASGTFRATIVKY
jgi:hypothetical protein